MHKLPIATPARLSATLLALCLVSTAAVAQTPPKPGAVKSSANDEFLAKASSLYYSSVKAGLTGFRCTVHPEWHALFVSAQPNTAVAADDPGIRFFQSG